MPLLPSEILNQRYRIVSLLGAGSYGAVYWGWDTRDEREVAIKEYLDVAAETQKLFRAEAARLSNLKHPQLPQVLDHFHLEKQGQYLISVFISGPSLQELLDLYGPLPSDLIINWLQDACDPVRYLHEKKQLHLNIKPANLRVTPDGKLILVDTGLPGLGVSLGTSGFASPEQQMQGIVTAASDIYGLGATLYKLLTGVTPPDALRRESGLAELTPAREINPDVEPYLSAAAGRAMDMRPEVRFGSMDEFARALERPPGRRPLKVPEPRRSDEGRPFIPPPRAPKVTRKQIEQRTILGLLIVLVLLSGILLGLFLANRTPAAREERIVASATFESQVLAALTAITTPTASPAPSLTPVPTPEPLVDEKTAMRMIYVPPGIFRMGNDENDPDEAPSHIIRLDAYYIDETEVTNGQYTLCVEDGACQRPSRAGATFHPAYYGDRAYDDYPVINVGWFSARDFCAWRESRLPSEAEWEKAASFDPVQGIKYRYPWGDEFDGRQLNFCDVNCTRDDRNTDYDDGHRDTAPVGSYQSGRSPLGLYDMLGNVMEWVADWYDPRYYAQSTDTNPLGPLEGEFKALRGGSWLSSTEDLRVSGRSSFDPVVARANLGFRCALTAQ